jgi:hypothetical protein
MARRSSKVTAPIYTAADGTIIGRINDLEKKFGDLHNAVDLSNQSAAFIATAAAGLAQARTTTATGGTGQTVPATAFYDTFQQSTNFSPGLPILPVMPDDQPRQFQYQVGTNYQWIPRLGYGLLTFPVLRTLSWASKEIRLNINLVKRILRGMELELYVKKPTVDGYAITPDMEPVRAFWEKPDGYHTLDDWIDLVLEDALSVGTTAIYPEPDPNRPQRAYVIDATLWRITTDFNGRVPEHPAPAYIQVTYGRPNWWASADRLLYFPLLPAVNNPYGYSIEEGIVQSIVQSIKRDSSRTAYFTEGNVPAAFVGLPTSWTPTQIEQFSEWYNALMQGDVARTQKLMFIPHDGQGVPVSPFTNINMDSTAVDEYLLKVACYGYGNSPTEFGITGGSGLGGKGFMEGGQGIQYRGSIKTYTQYISRIIETINRRFLNAPWAKVKWKGLDPEVDQLQEAQVEQTRISSGVWSVEYVQDQIGYPRDKYAKPEPAQPAVPVPGGAAPQPAANYRPTKAPVKVPPDFGKVYQRATEAELLAWRDKERFYLAKGLQRQPFRSHVLDAEYMQNIGAQLEKVSTRADIDQIFGEALAQNREMGPTLIADPTLDALQKALDLLALEMKVGPK